MNVGELKQRLMLSDPGTPFAIQVCFPSGAKDSPSDPSYFGSEDERLETAPFLIGGEAHLDSHLSALRSLMESETDDLTFRDVSGQANGELIPLLEALLERAE